MYDIIIIGAGPAGMTAAVYACRAGHSVCLFEGSSPGGQAIDTQKIENWPGTHSISGADFAFQLYDNVKSLGIPIEFARVTGIQDRGSLKIIESTKGSFESRAVILANGLLRRRLDVPGESRLKGLGVSYCAICDGNFFRGKEVAVIGGGDSALEDALYLSNLCSSVWLVHRREEFRAKKYLVDRVLETPNIHLLMGYTISEILGSEKVEGLLLIGSAGEKKLELSGVFAAIGFLPDNNAFAPPLRLDHSGFIVANDDCTTDVAGIFAAGDCRAKEFRQLVTAAADGAVAAGKAGQFLLER